MIGIMVSLPISGGHINPAVTVAFALSKKLKWTKVPHYIIAQYFGSFFAQVVLFVMYFDGLEKFDNGIRSAYGSTTSTGKIFATFPPTGVTLLTCIGDQVIGTALLLIGICAIIDARVSFSNDSCHKTSRALKVKKYFHCVCVFLHNILRFQF